MKKSRLTEEQIIGFLKPAEGGMPIRALCRIAGSSDSTFYGWRAKLGDMQVSEAQCLLIKAPMECMRAWRFVVNTGRRHAAKIRTSTACCETLEVLNTRR